MHHRELSLRRMMIPLISSPNVKRGRGEDGEWTSTLYFMDGATNEVVRVREDTIDAVEIDVNKPIARAVYRSMGDDQPRSESTSQGKECPDPGSPMLRRNLIKNLGQKYMLKDLYNTKKSTETREDNMLEIEIAEVHMPDKPDEDEHTSNEMTEEEPKGEEIEEQHFAVDIGIVVCKNGFPEKSRSQVGLQNVTNILVDKNNGEMSSLTSLTVSSKKRQKQKKRKKSTSAKKYSRRLSLSSLTTNGGDDLHHKINRTDIKEQTIPITLLFPTTLISISDCTTIERGVFIASKD